MDHRFRNVHRYAQIAGHRTGFATLEEGVDSNGWGVYHGILIPVANCDVTQARRSDLDGSPDFARIGDMFRAAHRYARARSYATGFPTFEQGIDDSGQAVFGIAMLKAPIAVVQSVPAADIGTPSFGDPVRMGTQVHRYARGHGALSGFPLYEQGLEGGVLKYGIALVDLPSVEVLVLAGALGIFSRFRFDPGIGSDLSGRLLERHAHAITRIAACSHLRPNEKEALRAAYRTKNVVHGSTTDPKVFARAPIGKDRINVNFGTLFPRSHDLIAETLIHEMMHCAGFTHPEWTTADSPGQGEYYASAPLRAEICIAGRQTLVGLEHGRCSTIDGEATILSA